MPNEWTAVTDEQYSMSEAHDTGEEPVLTGYVSSVPHRPESHVSLDALPQSV